MTLLEALRLVLQPAGQSTAAGPATAFFEQGEVTTVAEDGRLQVALRGATVDATPMGTDEVFKVGDMVWVSRAGSGYIVHGGSR